MKHRFINKKTGAEAQVLAIYLDSDGVMQVDSYDTVEDLMDDYAAYEEYNPPKEPLIKDGKICKIFRDWCVANGLDNGKFRYYNDGTLRSTVDDGYSIWFVQLALHVRLKDGMEYTLAELCGEEEE